MITIVTFLWQSLKVRKGKVTHTKNKYISTRTFLKRLHWISLHSPHLYAVRNSLILDLVPGAAQSICVCPDYEPHNLVWEQQPESQQDSDPPPTQTRDDKEIHFLQFCTFIFFKPRRRYEVRVCVSAVKGKGLFVCLNADNNSGEGLLTVKNKSLSRFFKAAFFKQSKNCLLDLNVVSNIKKKKNPISKL